MAPIEKDSSSDEVRRCSGETLSDVACFGQPQAKTLLLKPAPDTSVICMLLVGVETHLTAPDHEFSSACPSNNPTGGGRIGNCRSRGSGTVLQTASLQARPARLAARSALPWASETATLCADAPHRPLPAERAAAARPHALGCHPRRWSLFGKYFVAQLSAVTAWTGLWARSLSLAVATLLSSSLSPPSRDPTRLPSCNLTLPHIAGGPLISQIGPFGSVRPPSAGRVVRISHSGAGQA